MNFTTRFKEFVLDDVVQNLKTVRRAVFALLPESVILPWGDVGVNTESVELPDGGTIQFLLHRNAGRGFIARTYRCPGGGMDAPLTRYILLARKGEELVAVAVEWPRGYPIGEEREAVYLDGQPLDSKKVEANVG